MSRKPFMQEQITWHYLYLTDGETEGKKMKAQVFKDTISSDQNAQH